VYPSLYRLERRGLVASGWQSVAGRRRRVYRLTKSGRRELEKVVPENTIPPASWAEKPRDIFILQLVSVALWLLAGALATASAALAWTRWSHLAAPVLVAASAAVAASCAAAAAPTARWFALTPATPNWPLGGALAAACLLACVAAAGRARAHRRLLVHD